MLIAAPRTFRIELEIKNPDHDILDGVTAELFIKAEQVMAHKMSSAMLVLNDNGIIGVRTVGDDNKVQFQEIEILGNNEDGIWVSGIRSNSKLITEGHEFVKAGEKVRPVS